jgi:hypothetical protein
MVIGDQYAVSEGFGCCHSSVTGDTTIYGDDKVWFQFSQVFDKSRGQSIAMTYTVGNFEKNIPCPQHSQAADSNSSSGGAVAVKIAYDDNTHLFINRIQYQGNGITQSM